MMIGLVMIVIGDFLKIITSKNNFLKGPTPVIMPDQYWIIGVGLLLNGFGDWLLYIPSISEMIMQLKKKYPTQAVEASDKVSALTFSMLGLAHLFDSLYGGYATEIVGFRMMWTVVALFEVGYTIIYYTASQKIEPDGLWKEPIEQPVYNYGSCDSKDDFNIGYKDYNDE